MYQHRIGSPFVNVYIFACMMSSLRALNSLQTLHLMPQCKAIDTVARIRA